MYQCDLRCVGGAAGAVSRITGALGQGIATLTMDEDFQKKRREAKRPTGLTEGFAQGGRGLVMVCCLQILIDSLLLLASCLIYARALLEYERNIKY